MKKRIALIVLGLLAALSFSLFAVGCAKNEDVPAAVAGEDTVISSVKTNPKDTDPATAVFAALGKLNGYSFYESESEGTSVAEKGFITYAQKSSSKNVKHGDEFYTESVSHSTFVNMKHEAFAKGDNVAYRSDDGEIRNATVKDYKAVYGVTPAKLLSGHVFNADTVIYAKYLSEADGLYSFEIVLEKEKANALLSRQMKNFGNLSGYPIFSSNTTATLVMKSDFTPVSVAYESRYTVTVAVLGKVDCVENNVIRFKNFGEENVIPDTEAFNAAIGTKPSKVTPSKESTITDAEEKIMTAFLNADMERGVSLCGNAEINGFVLPVKLQVAADVNGILAGSAEAANAVKAKLTVANALSAIYSDGKVYMDFAGHKCFFDVPEISKENMDAFGAFDLNRFVKIADDGDGTYTVTLPNYLNATIYAALCEIGLASDDSYDEFALAATAYIPRDRIGVIAFGLKTDVINVALSFTLADEKLVLPENFDDYKDGERKFGASGKITFDSAFTSDMGLLGLDVKVAAIYDVKKLDPRKAFKAEVKVTLNDGLKQLVGLVPMLSAMKPEVKLPGWIATIGTADSVTLLYENKTLTLVLPATDGDGNGYIAHAAEIKLPDLSGILPGKGTDLSGIINFLTGLKEVNVKELIPLLSYLFTAEMKEGAITLKTTDFVNQIIQSAWQQIPEAIAGATGDETVSELAVAVANLYKPFAGLEIGTDLTTGETTIKLNVYDLKDANSVYVPGRDYEKQTLLSLTVGAADLSDYEYGYDTESILKNVRAAAPVIERINALENVTLDEKYLEQLNATKAAYDALDENARLLVYNANETSLFGGTTFFFDKYAKNYEKLVKGADSFITKANKQTTSIKLLIRSFNSLNAAQTEYAERTAAEVMNNFYEKRRAYEAEEVRAIIDGINAIPETNPGELTAKELLERLYSLNALYKRYNAVDNSVVTNGDALIAAVTETATAYGKKATEIAAKYVEELKRLNDFCDKSVAEMLGYYKEVTEARAYYYGTPANDMAAFAFVTEACPALGGEFCKVKLYSETYFAGFRAAAVNVAEKAIAEALQNKDNYSAEELKTVCKDIKDLCALTDETAINGYDDFLQLYKSVK